jgi:hypothetical protein
MNDNQRRLAARRAVTKKTDEGDEDEENFHLPRKLWGKDHHVTFKLACNKQIASNYWDYGIHTSSNKRRFFSEYAA